MRIGKRADVEDAGERPSGAISVDGNGGGGGGRWGSSHRVAYSRGRSPLGSARRRRFIARGLPICYNLLLMKAG